MSIKEIFYIFYSTLYYLSIIVYLILIIIHIYKTKEYNDFKLVNIINERVLYEQIAYEIYENIKKLVLLDLKIESICEDNYQPINFTIKLNPYYNCKYNANISHLFNKQFCIPKYELFQDKYNESELKYEELIKHSINKEEIENNNLSNICESGYKPCGILDTKNNILCFPIKYNCPLNDLIISNSYDYKLINNGYSQILLDNNISIYLNTNENIERPIIISIFLSFDKPWEHEWQTIISYEDPNKKEDDNGKRYEFFFEDYDKYMINSTVQNKFFISLDDIISWEKIDDFNSIIEDIELVNISQFYSVFHKNYIGFKNYGELQRFEKLFNNSNYTDNPLYFCSKTLYPYIGSLVICILTLFLLFIIYIILLSKFINNILVLFSGSIATQLYSIYYIILYFEYLSYSKKLEFNFDQQIQKVFDLYSKRNNKPIYTAAIITIFVSWTLLLIFTFFYFLCQKIKEYCGFCGLF